MEEGADAGRGSAAAGNADGVGYRATDRAGPSDAALKVLLLTALYTVRSERLFCEQLDYNFLFRWFLDLAADEASFDHSTFSRNRARLLEQDMAGEFLRTVVEQARGAFTRKWKLRSQAVSSSFAQAGDELFTFTSFPSSQWKALRTTNALERINEEFRRRTKTQASLPSEEAVLFLLFWLLRSGQITLRRLVGWRALANSNSQAEAA